jgi:outer membrane biosynthesis protein TonB
MAKRRSLADGLENTPKADPKTEQAFVQKAKKPNPTPTKKPDKPKAQPAEPAPVIAPEAEPEQSPEQITGRSPLSTRLRSDIGAALKRASLERELAKLAPHTVQGILEHVLEPWLKELGYLK